ncbi:MAG TPA: division/cell wall cluster transcriptional repressor MraZ [Candidatus Saccharimonadales bacterium]|nr:division/cell wall cluster transcriptional repressor MraZ [Candidatus Saccharimonadales bacterium]
MFTGEYRHTVDDKGRIAVPARFRVQLGAGAVVSRWLDACLAIHTQAGWEELATKVAALPITDQAARRFQRLIFAGAAEVELDRQGRILLPSFLRDHIDLAGDAVVVGSRDHAEIWVPATWATYAQGLEDSDALAQAFEGLGI